MDRREKFNKVIEEKGFKNVVELMIKVETILLGDKSKAFEYAQKNKNYYSMIAGTREFPSKYIVALEQVLQMKFIDMISPEPEIKKELNRDTLRTIAYFNDYEKTRLFDVSNSTEDRPIFQQEDEFGNYFIDYILEFSSTNCLKYLLDTEDLVLDNRGKIDYYYTSNNDLTYNVLKLLCEVDDDINFNKIFNTEKLIRSYFYDEEKIINDDMLKLILSTKKILNSLFIVNYVALTDINMVPRNFEIEKGMFCNFLLNDLLHVAFKEPLKYQNQLKLILEHSYKVDDIITKELNKYNKNYRIDARGIISVNNIRVGQIVKYDLPLLPETTDDVRRLLDNLSGLYKLEYREFNTFGGKKYQVVDGKLYIDASNNEIEYEMLKRMEQHSFRKVPLMYDHNEKRKIDILEYKKPYESTSIYDDEFLKIKEIAIFLKEFHMYSKMDLGENMVYLHNNLTVNNVSFSDNKLDAVVNWEKCSIGNPLNDILFVLVDWTEMSNKYRCNSKVLKAIEVFVNTYELDDAIKIGDELNNYLNSKINALSKDSIRFERDYEILRYTQIFVDLYKNKLNEREW